MPSSVWTNAINLPATWVSDKSQRRSWRTAFHIMDKPTDITIERHGTTLPAQTVRIEATRGYSPTSTRDFSNANMFQRGMTVFGILDHPTIPNLNAAIGDRFGYMNELYEVQEITRHAGEIQLSVQRFQP